MPLHLEIVHVCKPTLRERFLDLVDEAITDARDATTDEVRLIAAALAARLVEIANG